MTNEKLLDLLREARETMRDFAENWDCDTDAHKYRTTCRVCAAKEAQRRIDAALAERQDSATDVVEWRVMQDDPDFWEAYPADGETALDVTRCKDGRYRWSATVEREEVDYCDTEAEAKSAAIKAARGMNR
jgi:hypothetical protein